MAFVLALLLCLLFTYFAVVDGRGAEDWETILFQWTMPGLDEEIFYRGVLLLAMNEAFRTRVGILGAPIGYGGFLTSVLFGLAHAVSFTGSEFQFDPATFALTGIPSLLLLWMREKTGSVLLPVFAHNFANGISTVL